MTRKHTLTGIAVIALAGAAIAGSGLSAQARSNLNPGTEYVTDYWSNAQHTTLVGLHQLGYGEFCTSYNWGTTSNYVTHSSFPCP